MLACEVTARSHKVGAVCSVADSQYVVKTNCLRRSTFLQMNTVAHLGLSVVNSLLSSFECTICLQMTSRKICSGVASIIQRHIENNLKFLIFSTGYASLCYRIQTSPISSFRFFLMVKQKRRPIRLQLLTIFESTSRILQHLNSTNLGQRFFLLIYL